MIPMVKSRRMLAVATSAIVALQWLDPSTDVHAAEGGQSVSEKRAEAHSASGHQGKAIQVSADLTHDIDRLEKRGSQSDVYDLFSRPVPPSSSLRSKGKAGGKEAPSLQPPQTDLDKTEVVSEEPVVITPSAVKATVAPIADPVESHPSPVAPPVIASPPPPPPPKPPALPFSYMGKLEEGDRTVYFLVKGDKLYMVKAGEDVDDAYSFDGEVDHQLQLTYKPLRIAQTLTVGR